MFYFYKYLEDHPIQNLHYFIEDFFEQLHADNKKQFSLTLLHEEFRPIAEAYEEPLLEPLKKIFNEYKKLGKEDRDKIYNGFKTNNTIETLCKGEGEPLQYQDLPGGIKTAIKDLFSTLSKIILKRQEYCDRYGNQKEHYEKFCKLNSDEVVCPFCGLTELLSGPERIKEDYDHFLPKGSYPFSSVNFRNLVPMCHYCNIYKGQKKVLYSQNNKESRRRVFYPYEENSENPPIKIIVEKEKDSQSVNEFRVEINGTPDIQEELEAWEEIFEIKDRYQGRIKQSFNQWIDSFKSEYKIWKRRGDNDFRDFLDYYCEVLGEKKFQDKAFLQKPFFECLAADEDFQDNLNDTIEVCM